MFYTIEISETESLIEKHFKYGEGFYHVKGASEDLVYKGRADSFYLFLEPWTSVTDKVKELFLKPEVEEIPPITVIEDNSGKVSEDFALKVLAITMNKEKFKDINQ